MHPELRRLTSEFGWRQGEYGNSEDYQSMVASTQAIQQGSVFTKSQWLRMDRHTNRSWWYRTRNYIILDALRRHQIGPCVWDIGCGSGVVSSFLAQEGISVVGVEPSFAGASMATERGIHTINTDLRGLCLPSESLFTISMFDVLEHFEDRDSELREIQRVLMPGAHLVLTVPALMMLWSEFDDRGHRIRYSKKSIRRELERNGFVIEEVGYFFLLTILPLILLRVIPYRMGRRRSVGSDITLGADGGLLGKMAFLLERSLAMRIPIGSSLLIVARKPVE